MKSKEFYDVLEGTWFPQCLAMIESRSGSIFNGTTKEEMCKEWVTDVMDQESCLIESLKDGSDVGNLSEVIVQFMKLYLLEKECFVTYNNLYNVLKTITVPRCLAIMKSKGDVYSGDIDKLKNFKDVAKDAGITIEQAWIVFFNKHFRAILAWCGGDYRDSESISGRIDDAVNYLFLLMAILKEKGKRIM